MQITPNQYATALYQVLEKNKGDKIEGVIKNFVAILIGNNDLSKTKKIIEYFLKIENKNSNTIEAEITSVAKLNDKITDSLKNYIIKRAGVKKVRITKKINPSLLGGVVIRYEDKVLDGSLKTKLNELKNDLSK